MTKSIKTLYWAALTFAERFKIMQTKITKTIRVSIDVKQLLLLLYLPQEKPYDYKHVLLSHQRLHDERKSLLSYVYNYSFSHFI